MIILSNIIPFNNFLFIRLIFKTTTTELYVLYILKMYAKFWTNKILFTIQSINSNLMHNFKMQKKELQIFPHYFISQI